MAVSKSGLCSLALWFALTPSVSGAATQEPPGTSAAAAEFGRIRSSSPQVLTAIEEAVAHSATFGRLVRSIEATDGIVFVEEGRCPGHVRACLTWRVTAAGSYRLLFVLIDARKSGTDRIASLGHELQHALEVLENRSLRTTAAILHFYMRGRSPQGRTVETAAAVAAGNAVFREVERSRSQRQILSEP